MSLATSELILRDTNLIRKEIDVENLFTLIIAILFVGITVGVGFRLRESLIRTGKTSST